MNDNKEMSRLYSHCEARSDVAIRTPFRQRIPTPAAQARNDNKWGWLPRLVKAVSILLVLLWFFTAVHGIGSGYGEQGRQQLETALRRAAVACYAAEGIYPPNVAYLTQHYGIQIDESRYVVFYDVFAENLMPDITVLEKGS